jgi:hypothetical protein
MKRRNTKLDMELVKKVSTTGKDRVTLYLSSKKQPGRARAPLASPTSFATPAPPARQPNFSTEPVRFLPDTRKRRYRLSGLSHPTQLLHAFLEITLHRVALRQYHVAVRVQKQRHGDARFFSAFAHRVEHAVDG